MITEIRSGIALRIAKGYELCTKCGGEGFYAINNKIIDCWCMELVRLAKLSDDMEMKIDYLEKENMGMKDTISSLRRKIRKSGKKYVKSCKRG